MEEYLQIGLCLKPQGVKGEVKVKPLTDNVERFLDLKRVFLESGGGFAEHAVTKARIDQNFAYVAITGFDERNSAELLRNRYLYVHRSDAVPLPQGRYYIADLIGCRVVDTAGEALGTLSAVIETGSNDVYEVTGPTGILLLPALKKLMHIDIDASLITVEQEGIKGLISDED